MNNKRVIWIAFFLLVVLQLWVPASVIRKKENILQTGTAVKFRTAPVDPNDYLRGKYIFLSFEETSFITRDNKEWVSGETVYVSLGTDSAGYARITGISADKNTGATYIKTRVNYFSYEIDTAKRVYVDWPFQKFYMEESKAPKAEKLYTEIRFDTSVISYALVKVKDGEAVLENVYINNKPIDAYIKK
ncbi:MAG: hypothetical protein EOO13_11970 [Chitinophagaceae bacterium]|nr:MAG: hypothetical protein EOO13_11970 [Chitinophagaceae bacterium]